MTDPFDEAVDKLLTFGDGIEAMNQRPWLSLPKSVVDARAPGLMALQMIEGHGPVGVRVGSIAQRTSLLWVEPELAIVQPTQSVMRRRATVYKLPSGFGPSSYRSVDDLPSGSSIILEETPGWDHIDELFAAVDDA